jgi:hypothetical protein
MMIANPSFCRTRRKTRYLRVKRPNIKTGKNEGIIAKKIVFLGRHTRAKITQLIRRT